MKTSKQIISEFLLQLTNNLSSLKTLVLNFTNPNILELKILGSTEIKNENNFDSIKGSQFDLIIGDLPFGLQPVETNSISKLKINKNWAYVLWALRNLEMEGKAFFLIEPSILFSQQGKRFLQDLSTEKYFINTVFELPEKLLYPEIYFQPIMIGFERKENQNIFIGEVTDDFNVLLENYTKLQTSENLSTGIIIERDKFSSFSQFKIETEINNLKTQYKDYSRYSLKDIGVVNLTRADFEDKPNSIYIPKIGHSQVVSKIGETTSKHQNYFQVVLNENIVKADFLAIFYHSELGKLILKSLTSGSLMPTISKLDIESSYVTIPNLKEQSLFIDTNNKFIGLQESINQFKSELSLNPKDVLDKLRLSFNEIQNKGVISEAEKLELQHNAIFNFLKDKKLDDSENYINQELSTRLNSNKTIRLNSMTLKYLASAEYVWQNSAENLDFSIAISEFGKAVENEMVKLMEKFKSTQTNISFSITGTSNSVNLNFNQSATCLNLEGLNFSTIQRIVEISDNSEFEVKYNNKIYFNHKKVIQTLHLIINTLLSDVKNKFSEKFNDFITSHFETNFRTILVTPTSNTILESLMPSHCTTRKYLDFIREVRNSAAHPSNHIRIKTEAEDYRKLVLDFFGFWCNHLK